MSTIALALGIRALATDHLAKLASDALYAVVAFFAVGLLAPRLRTIWVATYALVYCFAIEFLQLYHPPWLEAARESIPGRLVLGRSFNLFDLASYMAGVLGAVVFEFRLAVPLRAAFRQLFHWIWSYDLFVSYQWSSGGSYAVALAARMEERGFACFLDRREYAGGDDWVAVGRPLLRHARRLVVVATLDAMTSSNPVAQEIDAFRERKDHIILIVFGDKFSDEQHRTIATLGNVSANGIQIVESSPASSVPSPLVLDELQRTCKVLRRRRLRVLVATTALVTLATLLVLSLISRHAEKVARRHADDVRLNAIAEQVNATLDATGGWLDALPIALDASLERLDAGTNPAVLRGALARAVFDATPVLELPGEVNDARVAISKDNQVVAIATPDTLTIRSAVTGDQRATVADRVVNLRHVEISSVGDVIVRVAERGAQIWKLEDGKLVKGCPLARCGEDEVISASLSPDGNHLLVSCANRTHHIYEIASCKDVVTLGEIVPHDPGSFENPSFRYGEPVASFAADGDRVAIAGPVGGLAVWSIRAKAKVLELGAKGPRVNAVRFAVSADRVLALIDDGATRAVVWDLATGEQVFENDAVVAALSDDGEALATSDGQRIVLDDKQHTGPLATAGFIKPAFSSSGDRLVGTGSDGVTRVWDRSGRNLILTLKGHTDVVDDVALSSDGSRVVTSGTDGVVRVWALDGLIGNHALPIDMLELSGDGRSAVSGSSDGEVVLWDVQHGTQAVKLPSHEHAVRAVYSGDSRRLVTASDAAVRVFGASDGKLIAELPASDMSLHHIAASEDGAHVLAIATLGRDKLRDSARVWDVAANSSVDIVDDQIIDGGFVSGNRVALLRSGMVQTRDQRPEQDDPGSVHFWSITGAHVSDDLVEPDGILRDMAISTDGKTIATVHLRDSHWIGRLWHEGKYTPLGSPIGSAPEISQDAYAVFSRDGHRLATYCHEPSATIWDVETGRFIAVVRTGSATIDDARFSGDGTLLLTHDHADSAVVWSAIDGARLARFDNVERAQISEDGRVLVVVSGRRVRFVDLDERAMFERGCRLMSGLQVIPSLPTDRLRDLRNACAAEKRP